MGGQRYDPAAIEARWQARWQESGLYRTPDQSGRPKYYALTMYPYPSGDLLHMGHWWAYVPPDARARFMRMRGYNVLFPTGFDAFGLPAENAAIQRGVHPREWTYANIDQMRRQLRSMGAMFDWSREIVTCDPEYYRWNQWFFLKFLERGLAYRRRAAVDFCPSCNTTLAREQVVTAERLCERCSTPVVRKDLEQWFFRTTAYAEELLSGLDGLEWPEAVKLMQRNWIGRSVGAEIDFPVADRQDVHICVFTTRADTLFGTTAVVLAPEHPLVDALTAPAQAQAVSEYRTRAARQSETDRLATERPKTGVPLGRHCVHPLSGEPLPIWVGDYVLMTYGSGAVMSVPAHDERDWEFARQHGMPIVEVVAPPPAYGGPGLEQAAYVGPGYMVNSGGFDGLVTTGKFTAEQWSQAIADEYGLPPEPQRDGKAAIVEALAKRGLGRPKIGYRLHDWLVSRQRYWGTPIPIIYCPACGTVPVPVHDLPVLLPERAEFVPTGESPLKRDPSFRRTICPTCGGAAERDTDTLDTFVDSSWYQYRYLSPHFEGGPFDTSTSHWLPVDQYTGGIEHATMHLLYTRFWTKAMRDLGLVDFDEPMLRLFTQGIMLGADGEKMSKRRGNAVTGDELVSQHGADAVRAYLMFIGPWEKGGPWDARGIQGVVRWLQDVWELVTEADRGPAGHNGGGEEALRRKTHQTVRKVTDDLEAFRFNTAVSALMELRNAMREARQAGLKGAPAWNEAVEKLILMLAPIAPHLAEELWAQIGREYSVHDQQWPAFDPGVAAEEMVELAIQVNGKVRDRMTVAVGTAEDEVRRAALSSALVQRYLNGQPKRVVYVPGRLVNVVVD
jgi:leucyl-tRNA synthetase